MRLRSLFLGLSDSKLASVASSIEAASSVDLITLRCDEQNKRLDEAVYECDAIFISRHLKDTGLERRLRTIRKHRPEVPVVLVYDNDVDGKAFLFARKYDCWLFSDADRLGRTLTPVEVGAALLKRCDEQQVEKRLMAISLCSGPCSTGD